MIPVKCPHCEKQAKVPDTVAGKLIRCPGCKETFRVSVPKTVKAVVDEEPAEDADEKEAVTAKPASRSAAKRRVATAVEEDSEAEDVERERDDEEAPRKKKKKKKRKREEQPEPDNSKFFMILGLAGLGSVVVVGLVVFGLVRLLSGKEEGPRDPEQVAQFIKELGGMVERDPNSPGQPIVTVIIAGVHFSGRDANILKDCPKVKKLILSHCDFSDVDMGRLESLHDVEELSLDFSKVTDGGISSIKQMTKMKKLSLGNTLVSDNGLKHCEGMTQLQEIVLTDSFATGLGLKQKLPNLKIIK